MTPPATGLPAAADLLAAAIGRADWSAPALGGPRWPEPLRGDPPVLCLPMPRMTIVLAGRVRYAVSDRGARRVVEAGPGQVLHFASNAWNLCLWSTPVRFLGVVFRPGMMRVLLADIPAGGPRGPTRTAHHTRAPLAGPALGLLRALDGLADLGPPEHLLGAAGDAARSLARLAHAHLVEDLAGGPASGSLRTWQEAMEHLGEHLLDDLSRTDVARAVGVHPNYLSTLCTRHGGTSFQQTVEGLRIERAKSLLRTEPGLRIAEIGRRCGFPDAGHFIRVFRRRTGHTPGRFARS